MTLGLSLAAQTPRLCLYEEFTGETCGPCAQTNPGLNTKLAANSSKIVAIKWQVPIPSAPTPTWSLYKTNKTEIDWRYKSAASGGYGYNPPITYAPFGKIDGQSQAAFGATGSSVDHPANLTAGIIATAQSNMSAFSITMTRAWNSTGTAITLTVNIVATAPFTAVGPLVFRTVMVEREIHFATQPGTNGETDFYDVGIASFPSIQAGMPMASTWAVNQSQTFTLNCTIPSYTRRKDQIAFVGFIQDDGNQKVAQAVRADKALLTNDPMAVSAKVPVTCNTSISPEVTITNNGTDPITAMTITPSSDAVTGAVTNWTGNLASGATTIIALNPMTITGTPGPHLFSFNITAANALDFNTTNNTAKVNYVVANSYNANPVSEGFVSGAYPPAGFTVINPDAGTATWARSTQCGGYNLTSQSTKYDFFNNAVIGDKDELFLPPVDLSGSAAPDMFFDYAYAQKDATSDDALDVMVSSDCGATWTNVWNAHGLSLATAAAPVGNAYIPNTTDPSEWKTAQFSLTGFNLANVLVKFVTTSDNGNNLFLDNINLVQSAPVGIAKINTFATAVGLYPNPTSGITNVTITSKKSSDAKISVVNTLGQVVAVKEVKLTEGANSIQLDMKEFAAGIYNVTISTTEGSAVKKLNVTK